MKREIIELVEEYETIIIHRHVRPDPDALGSQAGLGYLIKQHYPNKKIFLVGEEENSLQFIVKMDQIEDSVFSGALIIICDTANIERISDERFAKGAKIVKIDHHPNDDAYGDIQWIDTNASSVSEMIYELYEEWSELKGMEMTTEAARCLYAGIIGDTGRFRYPNSTSRTFFVASELVKHPFEITDLYEQMERISLNDVRLEGYVLNNFTLLSSGVGTIRLTKGLLMDYGVTSSEASKLLNAFANVDGLKAWVFFVEENDLIRVRLRSKGPIINGLAQKYNGGGHPLAAGASVRTWEEAAEVVKQLEELCLNYTAK